MTARRKEPEGEEPLPVPDFWFETFDSVTQECRFDTHGRLSVKVVNDSRPVLHRMVDSFLTKFFPSGYPYSVNEGYLTYTQFRALQHFSSAALSVLSTQSLLFAAGLRPTPAQATAILKDGMQHAGKLICSKMGARMDSEPKSWRILADILYDVGTGLEVLSPLCPQLFLEVAGLGNFAKMIVGPLLSAVHIYSVTQEMRAAPVNTLNPQRMGMVVADFLQNGRVSSPADLRYLENLLFPNRIIEDAGSVKVGRPLRKVFRKPSKLEEVRKIFPNEKFLTNREDKWTDMVLEHSATGEDALRGWLVAAYATDMEKLGDGSREEVMRKAYKKMESVFPSFVSQLKARGWHTDRFLDGNGCRFAF